MSTRQKDPAPPAPGGRPRDQPWTREEAIAFFKAHPQRTLVLGQRGSALRVVGLNAGVLELEACSTEYQEAELEIASHGLHLHVVFLSEVLSLHLLIPAQAEGEPALSLPVAIPYEALRLRDAADPEPGAEPEPEEVFSPYELLFSGSE